MRHRGNQFYTLDWTPGLEDEINRWLSQNPAIAICEIRQSLASRWIGQPHCVVTVWYEPPKCILSKEAAEKLVLEHVTSPERRGDIIITEAIERPFGWVFCYNSKRYLESGDDRHSLVGNYPILVDRHTSALHSTGLGKLEDYIESYEQTGTTRPESSDTGSALR